jgi:hypothetical protein
MSGFDCSGGLPCLVPHCPQVQVHREPRVKHSEPVIRAENSPGAAA